MKIGSVNIDLWFDGEIIYQGFPDPRHSERQIELPLAKWFVDKFKSDIIEVGAVTPYYFNGTHDVVDPGDQYSGCIRTMADKVCYDGVNLLSISTIEHVSNGEYGQENNPETTIGTLKKMVGSDNYLITWAAGFNHILDCFVEENLKTGVIRLRRDRRNEWSVVNSLQDVSYGKPFPYGNGVYVITNCDELLINL